MIKRIRRPPAWALAATIFCSLVNVRFLKAQQNAQPDALPAATQPSAGVKQTQKRTPNSTGTSAQPNGPSQSGEPAATPASGQQPKRILGVMPNFRAVSAGAIPTPPTPKEAFKIATQNSFDYSSFIFVGITSLEAEGTNEHADLGKGLPGFWNYYWRGFLDKTDGNYLVIFALPTVFHEDDRYFAMGKSGFWKRGIYAADRVIITRDYHGRSTVNLSEMLGRGAAQGISAAYYPSHDRTLGALATKYAYAIGRDAFTNVFREFWPDISTHVLHRQP
jgi:hypothetical protein